jgi:hypothetical protein
MGQVHNRCRAEREPKRQSPAEIEQAQVVHRRALCGLWSDTHDDQALAR